MAIDSRIPLMGQPPADVLGSTGQGLQFGQGLRQLLAGRQAGKMQQLDDVSAQKDFANKSMFSRELNAQIKANDTAAQKRLYDQLKTEAEISKIGSEAFKNNQQGAGYGLDNSGKKMGAINGAILQGAQTGSKDQIILGLDGLRRTGMLDQATFDNYAAKLNMMTPDEIKRWGSGVALGGAKDPAALFYADANTVANNAQSDANNVRDNKTRAYGIDVVADTANKDRDQKEFQFQQSNALEQQKQFFEQNKPLGFETGADGYHYAVYANSRGIRVLGEDGQPIKMQVKGGETQAQKMDRQAKVENFVSAASSASDAAKLATSLADDSKGLNKTAGGYGIMARIPGTDARNFATKIETLQSQVFLNQVEKMRGLGALTDFEGKKLETSIASLDINLEPKQLQQNLTEIAKIMKAAEQKAIKMQQIYSGDSGSGGQKQQSEVLNFFE